MICDKQLFPARINIHGNILNNIYQLRDNTVIIHGNSTEMYIIPDVVCNPSLKTFQFGRLKTIYHTVKKIAVDPAEEFLYSFVNERLIRIDLKKNLSFNTIRLNQAGRLNNVFIDRQNQVVINATRNFYYTPDSLYYIEDLEPYNGLTITSHLKLDSENELYNFIGNKLILMHNHNHYDLTEEFRSMIDYRIKDMVYDGSTLFFFTSRTIYFISNPLKIIDGKPLQLNRLNIEFNDINDMVCQENTLYIATDDGLILIPVEDCIDAQVLIPKPYFSKVYLDEIDYNFNSGAVEFKDKRRLTIEFGSQNYSSFPSSYSYMLEGIDKNWIEGNELRVVYLNLSPGKYTFKLKARKGMEDYSEIIELPVLVTPTFFQRKSTIIILSLLIALLIYWIARFFYRIQIKKKETDNLLITLEHKALQSMMNPHFIFNALGSIQRYLLQNKAEEAGTYLSQFARLIRQNMNSLKSNSISIDDEVERLKNYLELEKLRMNNKFEYILEVDEKIDGDEIEIPSMIVQPFVENAIWHGISPLEGAGKITVRFEANDEKSIAIVIEDNGIGMARTKTFSKSEQNLNMGVSITEKRLKLIGERLKMNSEIITEELFPGNPNPGTRITLQVPMVHLTS
jgi:two-component sensor histidine kinase